MRETFDRQVTEAENTKQGIFIVIVTDALFYTVSLLTWISPHICSSQWIDCSMKVVLIIWNFLLKKWKSRNQFPPLQAHSQISSLSPVCKSIFCLIVIVYMCYRMRGLTHLQEFEMIPSRIIFPVLSINVWNVEGIWHRDLTLIQLLSFL